MELLRENLKTFVNTAHLIDDLEINVKWIEYEYIANLRNILS